MKIAFQILLMLLMVLAMAGCLSEKDENKLLSMVLLLAVIIAGFIAAAVLL